MDHMIDPPSGGMYGFPQKLTEQEETAKGFNFHNWLVDKGYPRELIEEYGDMFHVRCWIVQ